ncbi:MAG TPA: oxygen-dependent coproporphyrinogen oxidase [Prolixibacteraceae bacterium]|nr:oxygen-dependent coproporphyrinogen oxidase [Prolixibacteraceae bacterium]
MSRERSTDEIARVYSGLQNEICRSLEATDGQSLFVEDNWANGIGNGKTCAIRSNAVIEKGGVNFSFVKGDYTPRMEQLIGEKARSYEATGISSIMHPVSPHLPIIHMNVRFFSLDNGTRWFGGGIDLSPHYIDVAEASDFHRELKRICDKYDTGFYPRFKEWADDYFYIPHRNETRGVGGIFFDRLKPDENIGLEQLFDFTRELALAYPVLYGNIAKEKKAEQFSASQKKWQEIRRGRYAEFNLVYDRGTRFGFESNGNAESILISLPATAAWEYKYPVAEDSAENATLQLLRKDIDWINFKK